MIPFLYNARWRAVANAIASKDQPENASAIESLRCRLIASDKPIQVIDYGAGSRDEDRPPDQARLGVTKQTTVGSVARASRDPASAALLYRLVRDTKAVSCVELGTCVGISAAYIAAALQGEGKLVTLEGAPAVAAVAAANIESLGISHRVRVVTGAFHQTLCAVLKSSAPIDFFFNDGHHSEEAVIAYFNQALPNLSTEAVVVIDDIWWSPGMTRAWKWIRKHSRSRKSVAVGSLGIVLLR